MKIKIQSIRPIITVLIILLLLTSLVFLLNMIIQTKILFEAVDNEDYNLAEKAIKNGANINAREHWTDFPNFFFTNHTILTKACKSGNYDIVMLLIKHGVDVNKKDNYRDLTPIEITIDSAKNSRFLIANMLIEAGADIKKASPAGLFSSAIVVYDGDTSETKKEGYDFFLYLIEQGITPKYEAKNLNPLTAAAQGHNYNVVKYFIENKLYDVNSIDPTGNTALTIASRKGYSEIVTLLLDCGADHSIKDASQKTAYDHAVENSHKDIIAILSNHANNLN